MVKVFVKYFLKDEKGEAHHYTSIVEFDDINSVNMDEIYSEVIPKQHKGFFDVTDVRLMYDSEQVFNAEKLINRVVEQNRAVTNPSNERKIEGMAQSFYANLTFRDANCGMTAEELLATAGRRRSFAYLLANKFFEPQEAMPIEEGKDEN